MSTPATDGTFLRVQATTFTGDLMKPFRNIYAKDLNPERLQSKLDSRRYASILSRFKLQMPIEVRSIGNQQRFAQLSHLANSSI